MTALDYFTMQQAKAWNEITETVSHPNLLYANGGSVNSAASSASRTWHLIEALPILLRQYRIQTMLDVPCGDLIWMRHVDITMLHSYIGMDLIESLVYKHRQHYRGKNMAFRQANLLTVKRLPYVDMIMCRDFLYCLPTDYISQVIQKFRDSGSKLLLATTFPGADNEFTYTVGEFRWEGYMERAYDLSKPPFNMRQIDFIREIPAPKGVVAQDRELGLFVLNGE
jgi:hypothetical protein